MALEEQLQRIKGKIRDVRTVLIVVPGHGALDLMCAGVTFVSWLKRQGKSVNVVSSHTYSSSSKMTNQVPEIRELFLPRKFSFGSRLLFKPPLSRESFEIVEEGGNSSIVIRGVNLKQEDLSISLWREPVDLACVFGVRSREQLFEEFPDIRNLLQDVPTVLVDTRLDTELWGEMNLVSSRASGVSELAGQLLTLFDPETEALTPREATLLYMGVVDATRGFSIRNQNPETYEFVSRLIRLGADNAGIIQRFYFSKQLSELKVWGRALARLEQDGYRKFVWSRISRSDLERTGSMPEEARTVLDEMMVQTPESDIACLFLEHDGKVEVGVRNKLGGFPLLETFWKHAPLGGNDRLFFFATGELLQVERIVLDELTRVWDRLHPR